MVKALAEILAAKSSPEPTVALARKLVAVLAVGMAVWLEEEEEAPGDSTEG